MNTDLSLANQPSRFDDKFDLIVKYFRDRREEGDPKKVKLPAELQKQLQHWTSIHGLLSTGKYPKTSQQINAVLKMIPGISARTARNYLEDTKRFFTSVQQPNLSYERVMLIDEVKADIRKARKLGDLKAVAALTRIYVDLIGADEPAEAFDNRTIINIINFNPEQLGGQLIDDDALDKMIANLMADDKKKAEQLFDEYTDVSSAPEK